MKFKHSMVNFVNLSVSLFVCFFVVWDFLFCENTKTAVSNGCFFWCGHIQYYRVNYWLYCVFVIFEMCFHPLIGVGFCIWLFCVYYVFLCLVENGEAGVCLSYVSYKSFVLCIFCVLYFVFGFSSIFVFDKHVCDWAMLLISLDIMFNKCCPLLYVCCICIWKESMCLSGASYKSGH